MKRAGALFEKIATPENLRLAFWKAAKGKWSRPSTRDFAENLEARISEMSGQLLSGEFEFGNYRRFRIFEPKERVIHAAAFPERVAHHGILNLCEPVFEKAAIFDSYACRKGKGRWAALGRAQHFVRRHRWFLKMDVRRYFDSISHERLMGLLERKFKERPLLELFRKIVRGYSSSHGRGLPIGSLTSQHFANFYLGALDRCVLEQERVAGYVRYMDDFVIWSDERAQLKVLKARLEAFLWAELELTPKECPLINQASSGLGFLGARVFPSVLRMNRQGKVRFLKKLRILEGEYQKGRIGASMLQSRATALLAPLRKLDTLGFRRTAGISSDVDGSQSARTVSCGGALGTTTRTTRGARCATTTRPPTRTTTTDSGWPERGPSRTNARPEDAPVSVPSNVPGMLANSKGPAGASRENGCFTERSGWRRHLLTLDFKPDNIGCL